MRTRIAHKLLSQPDSAHATLDRREVEYLLRVADQAALQTECQVIQIDKPDDWTCLDTLAEAAQMGSRYMPEFRAEILTGADLCPGCKLRAALGE
jgi:hypothetical protein